MTEDRTNTTNHDRKEDSRRCGPSPELEINEVGSKSDYVSEVPGAAQAKPSVNDPFDAIRAEHPNLEEWIALANRPGWPGGVEAYEEDFRIEAEEWPTDLGWILDNVDFVKRKAVLKRLPAAWQSPRVYVDSGWVDPKYRDLEEGDRPSYLGTALCLQEEACDQYNAFRALDIAAAFKNRFLFPSWIPEGATGILFAPSECGKSLVAIDLALSIAFETPWLGIAPDPELEPGSALFLLSEGQAKFPDRLAAWLVGHGLLSEDFTRRDLVQALDGRAKIVTAPPRINDPNFCELLIREISLLGARVVVIDTLSGLLAHAGLNVEKNKDAGLVMTALNRVALRTGATILLIHHVGHNNTNRPVGAIGWRNGSDFMHRIKSRKEDFKQGRPVTLESAREKDWSPPEPISLRLREVRMIRDGEAVISGLVEPTVSASQGSKSNAPLEVLFFEFVRGNPGCGFRQVKDARLAGDSKLKEIRDELEKRGAITNPGTNGRHSYYVADGWTVSADRTRLVAPGEEL